MGQEKQGTIEEADEKAGIHLYVPQTESSDSVVPVRWCVCPSVFEGLKREEAPKPHILIVVVRGTYEVARRLVSLERMMEYISFSSPGKHRIFANIVWSKTGNVGLLKHHILDKDRYGR